MTSGSFITGIGALAVKPIEYSVIEGKAILEGDIVLGIVEEMEAAKASLDRAVDVNELSFSGHHPQSDVIANGIAISSVMQSLS